MTDKEQYKRAFNTLRASREIQLEAAMKKWNGRKLVIACACVIALLGVSATAYAYGSSIFGWGNNVEIAQSGKNLSEVSLHTDELTSPVVFEEGRMIFIVNEEHIDITDKVSIEDGFVYEYTDELGILHKWVVGLNSQDMEDYGYAEFLFQNGEMIGGYAHNAIDGETPWLVKNRPF